MEVDITYEKEDWVKFQSYLEKEIPKSIKTPWEGFFVNIIIWAAIGTASMFAFRNVGKFHWPSALYVAAFFIVIGGLFFRYLNRIKNAFSPSENGAFIGTHRFTFSEEGIESEGNGYKGFHTWSVVTKIVRDNGLIMLFIDTANAFVFPEHKLENPEVLCSYAKECNKQPSSDSAS